jgi:hypothetical protein
MHAGNRPTDSADETKKKMGRPATGHDPSVSLRIPQAVLDQVMRWAEKNDHSRSTAIVGLIERGLASLKERGE